MAFNWKTEFYRYRRYFMNIRSFYGQKKVRVYTEIVLSFLTTAFFLFFAVKPTLITITGLVKEIKDKRMVAQKLEEKINNLNIAQREYFAIQEDLYLVDQALPKDSQISTLVKQLEVLTIKNNVSLEGIQYSSVMLVGGPKREETEKIEFKLSVKGSYQDLRNFLLSLNKLRRILIINAFGFRRGKTEESLFLSVDGEAFYLKEN